MAENLSSVDLTGLQHTAQSQLAAVDEGMAQLNQAVSHAETLAHTWTGEAANSYLLSLENFQNRGTQLLRSLGKMHELMLTTHNQFSNAHQLTVEHARGAGQGVTLTPVNGSPMTPAGPVTPGNPAFPVSQGVTLTPVTSPGIPVSGTPVPGLAGL